MSHFLRNISLHYCIYDDHDDFAITIILLLLCSTRKSYLQSQQQILFQK